MYNEEDTILNNAQGKNSYNEEESTILNQPTQTSGQPESETADEKNGSRKEALKHIAINAGTGFAVGTLAAALMSATKSPDDIEETESALVTPDTPVTTDGTLPVAHSVNDSMSFGEAFTAAHDEVGPGGVFEWHGQLYNTYTEDEWNSLSHTEHMEFNSHLRVVGHPDYEANVEHHQGISYGHQAQAANDMADNHHANQEGSSQSQAEHHESHSQHTEAESHAEVISQDEPLVEVLGVEHITLEDGSSATVGGAVVDGQNIVVIDVDNDGMGDIMATDVNGDGTIDDSEVTDISQEHFDMSNLETGGINDIDAAGSSEMDYMNC